MRKHIFAVNYFDIAVPVFIMPVFFTIDVIKFPNLTEIILCILFGVIL